MRSQKGFQDFFSQPVEEFVIGNVRCELAFFVVEEKQINIRAVIQFATAKFSHRENGKLRFRRSVALPKFCIPMLEHPADANLCDL